MSIEVRIRDIWRNRLIDALKSGKAIKMNLGNPRESPDEMSDTPWGRDSIIPADLIRTTVLSNELETDPRGLRIEGAEISGDLDLSDAVIKFPLEIKKSKFRGKIVLDSSTIARLDFSGSHCEKICMKNAKIQGDVIFSNMTTLNSIEARGLCVDGSFNLDNGRVGDNSSGVLQVEQAKVGEDISADGLIAQGGIRAEGIKVGGQFIVKDARIYGIQGSINSLNLDGAHIQGGFRGKSIHSYGKISGVGAHVEGPFSLVGAELHANSSEALNLDGSRIDGDFFSSNLHSDGELRAIGVQIGGQLQLNGAHIVSNTANAANFGACKIGESIHAENIFVLGELSLAGSIITGDLILKYSRLMNLKGSALCLDKIHIKNSFYADSLATHGEVSLVGGRVDKKCNFQDSRILGNDNEALVLSDSSIGYLITKGNFAFVGTVDLRGSQVGHWRVDDRAPDSYRLGTLDALGWSLGSVNGWLRNNPKDVRKWLASSKEEDRFTAQPWREIADVYDRSGLSSAARMMRFFAAHRTASKQPFLFKSLSYLYGLLVGYGYYPRMTIVWFALIFLITVPSVQMFSDYFVPTNVGAARSAFQDSMGLDESSIANVEITGRTPCGNLGEGYPCFNSITYSASIIAPSSVLISPSWSPSNIFLMLPLMVVKFFGWVLTALLLAGLTGLLRKT